MEEAGQSTIDDGSKSQFYKGLGSYKSPFLF
jgi:hypothetical protein